MDARTWLSIVISEKSVWNYNLHVALMLNNKSYYGLVKSIDINKFFDVRWSKNVLDEHIHKVCGVLHNVNGPARIEYYKNGNIKSEVWYRAGKLHREDHPARIEYYDGGRIKSKTWYRDDKQHCEYGPAYIEYYDNGNTKRKEWYKNGKLHRERKPALIGYSYIGTVIYKEWCYDGKLYHEDGPVRIIYYNGAVISEEWQM